MLEVSDSVVGSSDMRRKKLLVISGLEKSEVTGSSAGVRPFSKLIAHNRFLEATITQRWIFFFFLKTAHG